MFTLNVRRELFFVNVTRNRTKVFFEVSHHNFSVVICLHILDFPPSNDNDLKLNYVTRVGLVLTHRLREKHFLHAFLMNMSFHCYCVYRVSLWRRVNKHFLFDTFYQVCLITGGSTRRGFILTQSARAQVSVWWEQVS